MRVSTLLLGGDDADSATSSTSARDAQPREALLVLCESLRPRLVQFSGRSLATLLHRLAKMGVAPSLDFTRDWCRAALPRLSSMETQELANVVWALPKLGRGETARREGLIAAWGAASQARFGAFTHQGLATSLNALGKLGFGEAELEASGWFAGWSKRAATALALFPDYAVVDALWALSTLLVDESQLDR
jgi:hypothetical protein